MELLYIPVLTKRSSKILQIFIILLYQGIVFVIGAVIPNFNVLVRVVSVIYIIQFTYLIPPILFISANTIRNTILLGEGFDLVTNKVIRHDSSIKRQIRSFTSSTLIIKAVMATNIIYALSALTLGGLGAYASIKLIIKTFTGSSAKITTFSCISQLNSVYFLTLS